MVFASDFLPFSVTFNANGNICKHVVVFINPLVLTADSELVFIYLYTPLVFFNQVALGALEIYSRDIGFQRELSPLALKGENKRFLYLVPPLELMRTRDTGFHLLLYFKEIITRDGL